jgi:NADH-quinone oxidoreductase subunit J
LGGLLSVLGAANSDADVRGHDEANPLTAPLEKPEQPNSTIAANPLSRTAENESLASIQALGRSLFGDYLFAVELAGTLLLVATIGAIAIAPRRRRGTL